MLDVGPVWETITLPLVDTSLVIIADLLIWFKFHLLEQFVYPEI